MDEIEKSVQRGPVHPAPSFLLGTNIGASLLTKIPSFSDSVHSPLSATGRWCQFITERSLVWGVVQKGTIQCKQQAEAAMGPPQQGHETGPLSGRTALSALEGATL